MKAGDKIDRAAPARPDFGMLRAGLAAAQANTPTALASGAAPAQGDPRDVLARLFGDPSGHVCLSIGGSFSNPGDLDPAKPKR